MVRATLRCRSRRRSAPGRWSAPPSPPARAADAWRSSADHRLGAVDAERAARFSASRRRWCRALRTTSTVLSSGSGYRRSRTRLDRPDRRLDICRGGISTICASAAPRSRAASPAVHAEQPDVERSDRARRGRRARAVFASTRPRRCSPHRSTPLSSAHAGWRRQRSGWLVSRAVRRSVMAANRTALFGGNSIVNRVLRLLSPIDQRTSA